MSIAVTPYQTPCSTHWMKCFPRTESTYSQFSMCLWMLHCSRPDGLLSEVDEVPFLEQRVHKYSQFSMCPWLSPRTRLPAPPMDEVSFLEQENVNILSSPGVDGCQSVPDSLLHSLDEVPFLDQRVHKYSQFSMFQLLSPRTRLPAPPTG